MKKILIVVVFLLIRACAGDQIVFPVESLGFRENQGNRMIDGEQINYVASKNTEQAYQSVKTKIVELFGNAEPTDWGENIGSVITEIDTDEKVVALTFDACDGSPDSFDQELIDFLIEAEVKATLFIGGGWIKENEAEFIKLANNPLFEIANHGYDHKPLSVTGESAYNIRGTANLEEAFDEVYRNQLLIKELTGVLPKYFRSGTAYYDDVAVEMTDELGLKAVNYNVLGDAGGTFNQPQIINSFGTAQAGSIFLFHMNKPNSEIASGVKMGIKQLKEAGYRFVQLHEYDQFLN